MDGIADLAPSSGDAGWRPDPTGHFEFRWWDGSGWTTRIAGEHADEAEVISFESLPPPQRVWDDTDVAAYADEERFARVFGAVTLPTTGLRRCEVAGEGQRQVALDIIAGPKTPDGVWVEKVAELRLEPDDARPDEAIAVVIDGQLVGHLAATEADEHEGLIRRTIAEHGEATCGAAVNGGWSRPDGGSEGSYGVHLYFGAAPDDEGRDR